MPKTYDNVAEFMSILAGQSVPGSLPMLVKNTTTQAIAPGEVAQIARFRLLNGDIIIETSQVNEATAGVFEV